jgi:hypothetical protein
LLAALTGLAGCRDNKTVSTSGAIQPAGSSAAATTTAAKQARTTPRALTITVGGLLVSLRQSGVPAGGRYQLNLKALNASDVTMTVPIIGNTPKLMKRDGTRVAGTQTASGFGPGARRTATDVIGGKALNRKRAKDADKLPPHTSATGVIWTTKPTAGQGYYVRWDLGQGRVAIIRLP